MKKWISILVFATCALLVCVSIPLHQTHTQHLADANVIQPDWWSDFGPNH